MDPKKAFVLMDDSFSISATNNRQETVVKSFSINEEDTKTYTKYEDRVPFNENRPVACWIELLMACPWPGAFRVESTYWVLRAFVPRALAI